MPRYLRWIAAGTAGVTIQFAFFVLVGAVAVGTGTPDTAGFVELEGFVGALVTFASSLVTILGALAVNDWLAGKYPIEQKSRAEERTP